MRDYLLGRLGDRAAGKLEEQYFTDRAVFLQLRQIETSLIQDYLGGRLTPVDRQLFEKRYLKVPEMRSRLKEVRSQVGVAVPPVAPPAVSWRKPALSAALLLAAGSVTWYLWYKPLALPVPVVQVAQQQTQTPVATLALSPGVRMGGGIQSKELTLPVAPGTVRLVLELPGQTTALDCTVRIAKPDGDPPVVWTSPAPIKSTASATGQIVTVDLNSTILRAADYIVQAIGPDGQTRERYVFRAR